MASGSGKFAGINKGRQSRANARMNQTTAYTSDKSSPNFTPF